MRRTNKVMKKVHITKERKLSWTSLTKGPKTRVILREKKNLSIGRATIIPEKYGCVTWYFPKKTRKSLALLVV